MTLRKHCARRVMMAGVASTLLSVAISQHALAQEETIQEEVIVLGIRQALSTALDTKRDADAIMDSINATDIGTLPDNNVAEALQRIPGIQVTRDGTGEGDGFQIRGITENRVELDGRTILPAGANNRNGSTRNIPATLVASLDAFKSQQADFTEGSLGGTVVVRTRKPLDTGFVLSGQLGVGKDSDVDDSDPKVSFLASNSWDMDMGRFGALINVSYEDYHESSHQLNVPSWRGWRNERNNFCDAACEANPAGLEETFHAVPQLVRIQRPFDVRERTGIDSVIQFAPNDNLEFTLHVNYNKFDNFASQQRTVIPFRQQGFARFDETQPFTVATVTRDPFIGEFSDANGTQKVDEVTRSFILEGTVQLSRPRFASNFSENEQEQWNNSFSMKWTDNEGTTIDLQLSSAESEQTARGYNFQLTTHDGNNRAGIPSNTPTLNYNFTRGGEFADLVYVNADDGLLFDFTDIDNLSFFQINGNRDDFGPGEIIKEDALKLDFDFEINENFTLETGIRLAERSAENTQFRIRGNNVNILTPFGNLPENVRNYFEFETDPVVPDVKGNIQRTWFAGPRPFDFDETTAMLVEATTFVNQTYNTNFTLDLEENFSNFYDITERTTAAYSMVKFNSDDFTLPFRGNIGGRFVRTRVNSIGRDPNAWTNLQRQLDDPRPTLELISEYTNFLPSATITFDLREDLLWRLHASKRMSRPNLDDISPSLSLQGAQQTGTRGNPDLNAKESSNFDTSLEWYFMEDASLSFAVFRVNLSSFFKDQFSEEQFFVNEEDRMNGVLTDFNIRTQVNGPRGETKGFELNYQQNWGYGFGGIFNYTYADSRQPDNFRNELNGSILPLVDTSENSYNLVLYWEGYGFEVRAAYNWREERYISDGDGNIDLTGWTEQLNAQGQPEIAPYTVALPQYEEDYGQLDASISYRWNGITMRLNGRNIGDEHNRQYTGIRQATRLLQYSGTRWEFSISAALD